MAKEVFLMLCVLADIATAYSINSRVDLNTNIDIVCQANESISIKSAVVPHVHDGGIVTRTSRLDEVKFKCEAKQECHAVADESLLGGSDVILIQHQCVSSVRGHTPIHEEPRDEPSSSHHDEQRSAKPERVEYRSRLYLMQRCRGEMPVYLPNTAFSGCPHPAFVAQHITTRNLPNAQDACLTSDERAGVGKVLSPPRARIRSLFYALDMTYTREGEHCVFDFSAPMFDCRLRSREDCQSQGSVRAKHLVSTGDYVPESSRMPRILPARRRNNQKRVVVTHRSENL